MDESNQDKNITDQQTEQEHVSPQTYQQPINETQPQGTNLSTQHENIKLSVVGLVLAIILPIIGLIVSFIAFMKVRKISSSGKTIALIGMVIGGLFTVITFVFLIFTLSSAVREKASELTNSFDVTTKYSQLVVDGNCDEAYEYWDKSSPFITSKENHDIDCRDSQVIAISRAVYANKNNATANTIADQTRVLYDSIPTTLEGETRTITIIYTISSGEKIYRIEIE